MGILSRLFGLPDKGDLRDKINNGALLLDVRTKEEYVAGHVEGAVNIPVSDLEGEIVMISKDSPVIVVCESGVRSAHAVKVLNNNGFKAYNGGSWRSYK
ncbi:MAG: rhodanese-like domain-containing protein [Fermentimonas sp.]|jgi:rhodanese-related sulfurtransferase|nr:rhodanese-like domain-containing protein [Fermentimonas sp.]MDD3188693.1 rhodanese-like domain-containing protein [Fermentimonas sp.]MDD3512051.1 rhodanese-like domain-containing protein [Fermentimonas sp.]